MYENCYTEELSQSKVVQHSVCVAGHLSPTESDGDMLGYDLYSSALADILSEPTMQPPICVGLYAQWGSGKSFLLKKLEGKSLIQSFQYLQSIYEEHHIGVNSFCEVCWSM